MSGGAPLATAILHAIVEHSLVDSEGVRVCHIDATAVLEAFSIVAASMIATSPETQTGEGLKRVLRRQARQLEQLVGEYRQVAAVHGSPFLVAA